jgi:bile acid:Na+ symporter, BASS family
VKQVIDLAIPAATFLLLTAVGLFLTPADFAQLRRRPGVVAIGVVFPVLVLPAVALGLVEFFDPEPHTRAGLLLIAVCPIGGISNTYSYLARASTALSVALTGLSSLLAVVTIPLITKVFEHVLHQPLGFTAPASLLVLQLILMLALPIGLGMSVRHRRPAFADVHSGLFQRGAFAVLAALIVFVIVAQADAFLVGLRVAVPMSAAFVVLSFAVGGATAALARASRADRFTLATEFATRNVAIATAMAVTLLGRIDFAVFATIYFLTEVPIMLAAIVVHRRLTSDGEPR